jgi:hypothetical protein
LAFFSLSDILMLNTNGTSCSNKNICNSVNINKNINSKGSVTCRLKGIAISEIHIAWRSDIANADRRAAVWTASAAWLLTKSAGASSCSGRNSCQIDRGGVWTSRIVKQFQNSISTRYLPKLSVDVIERDEGQAWSHAKGRPCGSICSETDERYQVAHKWY